MRSWPGELARRRQLTGSGFARDHFDRRRGRLRGCHLGHDLPELAGGALPGPEQVTSAPAAGPFDVPRDQAMELVQRGGVLQPLTAHEVSVDMLRELVLRVPDI